MWDGQPEPAFLTFDEVLELHQEQIRLFGGEPGIINPNSIDSAINQPKASFGGKFLHTDIFEMAAVYLCHLASNHGFQDGNKRVGNAAAHTFLMINGIEIDADPDEMYQLVIDFVTHKIRRDDVAHFLRSNAQNYVEDE